MKVVMTIPKRKKVSDRLAIAMHKRGLKVFTGAARAHTDAIISVLAKHVDTGMTMGSMRDASKRVGGAPVFGGSSKDTTYTRLEEWREGGPRSRNGKPWNRPQDRPKSFTAGIREAKRLGSGKLLPGGPKHVRFAFEFNITVYQHRFHESDWQSLEKGKAAFKAHMEKFGRSVLPKQSELIKVNYETVVVNG